MKHAEETRAEAPMTGHIIETKKDAERTSEAWVFYIDDRRAAGGHAYRTRDGRDRVIGFLESPRGHTARKVADSIDLLHAEFSQWAGIGFPAEDPLVRDWTPAEKETFHSASWLDY